MNIDHIGFGVADFKKSREFYSVVLAPLGLTILAEGDDWAMMGTEKCDIWFGEEGEKIHGLHLAFVAQNHEVIQKCYEIAISLGAKDNGKPDFCPEYSPTYYAGFVIDPNGYNLEFVCRK